MVYIHNNHSVRVTGKFFVPCSLQSKHDCAVIIIKQRNLNVSQRAKWEELCFKEEQMEK